ncbi:DUF4267 domain-containing protein [Streptomyces sp. HD]|uniref:DUF4267 domain-containing protein n=1 Tax=Streptomyces sp. HD TaxID=3020892 RepID=UPI00232EFF96|nr:DUF4267 domain-containing protein [Streptomyces sp. HD]MDC0771163.1 DUF4267 domain-containing protein [Streptomyces sp. HD]
MTVTAYTLAVVLNLFCLFLGYRFLFQPGSAATGYGVPARPDGDAGAYLSIKGVRDGTFGVVGLALLFFVGARAEAWFMLAVAIVPLSDTLIVLRHGGTKAVAFGIHFATAAVVLISAALLFVA